MKKKITYNLIRYSTLLAPIIMYILLSATILNINYDYEIKGKLADVEVKDSFVYTVDKNASYIGKIAYNEELDTYGIYIKENQVIKVGLKFLTYEKNVVKEINPFQIQKKEGWKIPIAIVFTLIGIGIIVLLSFKKLKIANKYKELALLLSLGIGTGFLYVINMLVSSIFMVFLIGFLSYGAYLGEEQIHFMLNKAAKQEKKKSNTLRTLEEIANKL